MFLQWWWISVLKRCLLGYGGSWPRTQSKWVELAIDSLKSASKLSFFIMEINYYLYRWPMMLTWRSHIRTWSYFWKRSNIKKIISGILVEILILLQLCLVCSLDTLLFFCVNETEGTRKAIKIRKTGQNIPHFIVIGVLPSDRSMGPALSALWSVSCFLLHFSVLFFSFNLCVNLTLFLLTFHQNVSHPHWNKLNLSIL